jgi:hypothetical protein
MRENMSRQKYARYIKNDPQNPDSKRKALCAVGAKTARVIGVYNISDRMKYWGKQGALWGGI